MLTDWHTVPVFGARAPDARATVRPSAYGLIENERGQLALVRTPEGVFLPGGGIEAGETPSEAVVREALEECGLVVRIGTWCACAVQFAASKSEHACYEKRSTFVEALIAGAPSSASEPDHELVWVEASAARALLAHASHAWAIASWCEGRVGR